MTALTSTEALETLWADWRNEVRVRAEPVAALLRVLARGGTRLSLSDLSFALAPISPLDEASFERFADAVIPLLGGADLRLERAFGYAAASAARLPVEHLRRVLIHFVEVPADLDAMLAEVDEDGDGLLSLADFRNYYPHDDVPSPGAFRASHVRAHHLGREATETTVRPAALPGADLAKVPAAGAERTDRYSATSPLQMQIGFFRLLQGAAYRSFRASYAANAETHLRVRELPYTITDFAEFVDAAVELYLVLGIVHGADAEAEFRRLARLVADEVAALQTRIETWDDVAKTPGMLNAMARVEEERALTGSHRARFAECVELLLALRLHGIAPTEVGPDSLSHFDVNRLRHLDLSAELGPDTASRIAAGPGLDYLDQWTAVIMDDGARPDGAIMPLRFWYEEFMPQLLRCASIMEASDLAAQSEPDSTALDQWHAEQVAGGAFQPYALDVQEGFTKCPPRIRLALRQAWRLTEHYLNGLEKRREREEFGRASGYLSQYVAFIDAWLGRRDVEQSEMRLSFPYYIGPAVWCFLHSSAELAEAFETDRRADAIRRFKRFFRAFATMYPCPYCRHHLNRYVLRNSEVERYPIEFLLLGQRPDNPALQITPEDRLAEISAERPGSLRLFVWKLHNAVSSSIQRTEEWYHQESHPLYTTRFWPSLDAELVRARALGLEIIAVEKIGSVVEILKPGTRLAALREPLLSALRKADRDEISRIASLAQERIAELEDAVETSGYLTRTYSYDADKAECAPHFTAQEEAYARSGRFVER